MTDEAGNAPADAAVDHRAMDHVSVSWVDYHVPKNPARARNGRTVLLPKELDDGRPVVMNFIYTTL